MFNEYYYNESMKRIITVFGSLFNNIYVARKDGTKVTNQMRVPISYGPRKKFIERIRTNTIEDKAIAIKLPRLSFEVTSITYDSTSKLNKLNKVVSGDPTAGYTEVYQSVPYNVGITLAMYGNNQDDIFQILEQILPIFSPQYTVTIKGMEGPNTLTDVPFTLLNVNLQDNYEGEFATQRSIIHTIDFVVKTRFIGKPNDIISGIINEIDLNFYACLMDDMQDCVDASPPLNPANTVAIIQNPDVIYDTQVMTDDEGIEGVTGIFDFSINIL